MGVMKKVIEEGRWRSKRKTLVQEYMSLQEIETEHYTENLIKLLIQVSFVRYICTFDKVLNCNHACMCFVL